MSLPRAYLAYAKKNTVITLKKHKIETMFSAHKKISYLSQSKNDKQLGKPGILRNLVLMLWPSLHCQTNRMIVVGKEEDQNAVWQE